jgi:hypothetical protein
LIIVYNLGLILEVKKNNFKKQILFEIVGKFLNVEKLCVFAKIKDRRD